MSIDLISLNLAFPKPEGDVITDGECKLPNYYLAKIKNKVTAIKQFKDSVDTKYVLDISTGVINYSGRNHHPRNNERTYYPGRDGREYQAAIKGMSQFIRQLGEEIRDIYGFDPCGGRFFQTYNEISKALKKWEEKWKIIFGD